MAYVFEPAMSGILDDTLDLGSGTFKLLLINDAGAAPARTCEFVSDLNTTTNELNVYNYNGGYGGSGRHEVTLTVSTVSSTESSINIGGANLTWSSLGNGTNDTITGAVLFKEITSDAASPVIAWLDLASNQTTNGNDFTLTFQTNSITFTMS